VKIALMLGAACALFSQSAVAAQMDDLAGSLGVAEVKLEAGGAGPARWESGELLSNGDIALRGLLVGVGAGEVRYDEAVIEADVIRVTGARLSGGGGDVRHGEVRIESAVFRGEGAMQAVFSGNPLCAPGGQGSEAHLAFKDLVMSPPDLPLPDGLPGARGPERVSVDAGEMRLSVGSTCLSPLSADLSGVSVVSAAGDTGVMASLEYAADGRFSHRIGGRGISLADPEGRVRLSLGSAIFRASGSDAFVAAAIGEGLIPKRPPLVTLVTEPVTMELDLKGIRVAGGVSHVQGLPLPEIAGDFHALVENDGSSLAVRHASEFPGFYAAFATAVLAIREESAEAAAALSTLRGGDPRIEALGRFSLVEGSFAYADLGAAALMRETTGSGPGDMVDLARMFAGRVPSALRDPIFDWLKVVSESAGRVTFEPEAPVELARIGLIAAMQPAALPELIGMTASATGAENRLTDE